MRISDWSSDVCSSDLVVLVGGRCADQLTVEKDLDQVVARAVAEGDARRQHVPCGRVDVGRQRPVTLREAEVERQALVVRPFAGSRSRFGYRNAEPGARHRSEEHTSELQSLMRISYAVFCLKKKKNTHQ